MQPAAIEAALRLLQGQALALTDHDAPTLPAAVRQRLPAAQAHAEQAARAIASRMAPRMGEFRARLAAAQSRSIGRTRAVIMLRALAADHAAVVAPQAACRIGCTHCCHIPVPLAATEAAVIGRAIGRRPAPLLADRPPVAAGYDNPCPFLADGACSIHAHRPLACRVHFNLDADALLCALQPDGQTVPVPLGDASAFWRVYAARIGPEPVGDIRHFFGAKEMSTCR